MLGSDGTGCRIMGTITICNDTTGIIHVSVTAADESGDQGCCDIQPGDTESWIRTYSQVAFALREDNGHMVTIVVRPGQDYVIG